MNSLMRIKPPEPGSLLKGDSSSMVEAAPFHQVRIGLLITSDE